MPNGLPWASGLPYHGLRKPPTAKCTHTYPSARSQAREQKPVSRLRRGFTLIELLIVVVIIGILAAIAIPKFQNTKGKANFAAMRSDLRNLTTSQEAYFYDHSHVFHRDSTRSTSRRRTAILWSSQKRRSAGWSATATNPASYPHFCALFMGSASAVAPATDAGIVTCQ